MEEDPKCNTHDKPLRIYCKICAELLCDKCLYAHSSKGCVYPIDVFTYAEAEILPKYKARIDNFEEKKTTLDKSIKDFGTFEQGIKEGLLRLRRQLEEMLDNINKTIDQLEASQLLITIDNVKAKVISEYESLRTAIKEENLDYLVKKVNGKIPMFEIGDSEKVLIKDISKIIGEMNKSKEFSSLNESLKILNSWYNILIEVPSVIVKNRFIYGICSPQSSERVLCKYDATNKKLIATVSVPQYCSVNQIGKQVFISGGYENNAYMNTLNEFIESIQGLITKQPMKYKKIYHSIEAISNNEFVAIGGNNGNEMPYCEEYTISENKWREFPSLNKPRYFTGTALLNMKYLYAIGGTKSDNTIEFLNIKNIKQWAIVDLACNEVKFGCSPASFPISDTEIMILCGGNSADVGILDVKFSTIKNYKTSVKTDYYEKNSASIMNNKAYIIGYNGHVHIYYINLKKFEELEYSEII